MKRVARWIGAAALVALLAFAIDARRKDPAHDQARQASLARRLLGPMASLAASIQWTRADLAFRAGREELGLARAATALELDPRSSRGWTFLAHHLIFDLGAPGRGDDATRAAWIRAGLELLTQAEAKSDEPAEVAFDRGLVHAFLGSLDDADRAWPASAAEAWREAAAAFERAAALGHALGQEAAADARAAAGG